MSLFENLPCDIQMVINEYKIELETKDLYAFIEDFDMIVTSCKKLHEEFDTWREKMVYKYRYNVHLTYRPTNKAFITTYTQTVHEGEPNIPRKKDLLYCLSMDLDMFLHGDWSFVRYDEMTNKWIQKYSYQTYLQSYKNMSKKEFLDWKYTMKRLRLVLQDRSEKFIKSTHHNFL